MEDVSEQLQRMQNELQQNNLLSEETMQKYMELQELMDEMTSEELKKALEDLRNTLQQLNRNMTQEQLQNIKFDEERFKKSIERTLNLLKRIQIEQEIDELIKRTEDLTNEQSELKEQTEQGEGSDRNDKNKLSDKQKDISEKLDDLNNEMKSLDEKMSELEDMPQEELNKIMEEMKEQQNENLSEQASRDIQQNEMQKAMQQQQQIEKNMSQLNQQLQDLKDQMMMQNQMQTFTDMMKILDNMLELSKRQEELKDETRNSEPNSSSFNEKAEVQENLKRNLSNLMNQMSELSQKTFAITPEMGRALGDAQKKMQQSIQAMQNRNGAFAGITQEEAMMHLNEAALMMKGSMEAMMQGGGGSGGMMSLMQQLQQMSGQQMKLNNLTQMLKQMQQGQLSPQQQGEMQRLSQQQDLIRKSLSQLNEEAKISGESKKIPADLESIMNEMFEVLTAMKTEKLDDDLIQKQEQILSKLLDAQRSINERDFEKERKSKSGENVVLESPFDINLDSEAGKDKLRDELNKAIQEGYVKDFEELIMKYYNAIQKDAVVE
jgi:chromosome segregation ATPase